VRDLYYTTSLKTCYTPVMSSQPAYRTRNQAGPSGGWGILVPFFAAMIFAVWPYAVWHGCRYGGGSGLSGCGAESEWVWNAQTWAACGTWWGILASPFAIALLASAGKRRPAPPKGRLPIEVLPDGPAPPICLHPNAVRIDSVLDAGVIYRCWCPDCDPECRRPLPAAFRLSCCGAEPGTGIKPARHMYNCPQGGPR